MGLLERDTIFLVLFFVGTVCGSCKGSVYKVGDGGGWAIIGNVDYNGWASSKAFEIGDTLVFEYVPQFHNVLQVSRSDFHACNAAAPISSYTTGNDSIVIRSPGQYYYICGFVGHCAAGQKIDIRVPKSHRPAAVPSSSPAQTPRVTPIGPIAPSPSPNGGESIVSSNHPFSWLLLVVLFWAFK